MRKGGEDGESGTMEMYFSGLEQTGNRLAGVFSARGVTEAHPALEARSTGVHVRGAWLGTFPERTGDSPVSHRENHGKTAVRSRIRFRD